MTNLLRVHPVVLLDLDGPAFHVDKSQSGKEVAFWEVGTKYSCF